MAKQWLVLVLLSAFVGAGVTAMGFILVRPDAPTPTAPVALPPTDCAPVACEAVECEPVACVEPEPASEEATPEPPSTRMRRRTRGTTHQVLNPWDNADPPGSSVRNEAPPASTSTPTMGGATKVLDPWN